VAFALFADCFTCGKDLVAATEISKALTERGIAELDEYFEEGYAG